MADAKPSEASKLFHKDHHKEVWWLLAALVLLGYLAQRLVYFLDNIDTVAAGSLWGRFVAWLNTLWPAWKVIAIILVAAGIVWAIRSFIKMREIKREEEKIFGIMPEDEFLEEDTAEVKKENEKWLRVQEHANSDNHSDWRLAIIEADVMLEELLKSLGYHGDGVGEMLKTVDPSDMTTLDNAWEAHKIRNRIAHAGGDFQLNERETKRVISLFESVFREFQII